MTDGNALIMRVELGRVKAARALQRGLMTSSRFSNSSPSDAQTPSRTYLGMLTCSPLVYIFRTP